MSDIRYILLDPTGNITALVETPVPEKLQPSVAARIMKQEPETEQVGFISLSGHGVSVRMAGGEFCGNAAMSAAVLYAVRNEIRDGTVSVCFAGQKDPVSVSVAARSDGSMKATVKMPSPLSVEETLMPDGVKYPVVRFSGISHVIAESGLDRDTAQAAAEDWCRFLNTEALGIMIYARDKKQLTPLVYVPSAGTLCWENSCASGTTAVGAFLFEKEGFVSVPVRQPGGILSIESTSDGDLLLTGSVRILRYGNLSADIQTSE